MSSVIKSSIFALTLAFGGSAVAEHHEDATPDYAQRAMAIEVDAQVIAIDAKSRELVLQLPTGQQITTIVAPGVERLDEVDAGDFLVVTYLAALAAELREPTAEELANPWIEDFESEASGVDMTPGGAAVSAVRAVCTIEGMNRLLGTVTILDSRGKAHVIGDVAPERITTLSIGQSAVITFTQAVAVGIEKLARTE